MATAASRKRSPTSASRSAAPGYRIGAAARLTGISPHSLRMWERRYGAFATARSEGGDRLYSERDIQRLRLVRRLLERGHSIGQLARLPARELSRLLEQEMPAPSTLQAFGDRFLASIAAMDLLAAEAELSRALAASSTRQFALELVPELLREVGRRWQSGDICVAHEHAASALVRSQLGALLHTYAAPGDAPSLVAATLEGELHELGALLVSLIAAMNGWHASYLGPSLPVEECVRAVKQSGARALAISSVVAEPKQLRTQLGKLARGLPGRVEILLGGAAAGALAQLPPRVHAFARLDELDRFLRDSRSASA